MDLATPNVTARDVFVANARDESRQRVESGHQPRRRMLAPPVPAFGVSGHEKGAAAQYTIIRRGRLGLGVLPRAGTAFVELRGGDLAGIFASETDVEPPVYARVAVTDRATADELHALCRKVSPRLAHEVALDLSAPASNKVVVLADALRRGWWAPTGTDPYGIGDWRTVFRAGNTADGLRELVGRALSGSAQPCQIPLAKTVIYSQAQSAAGSGTGNNVADAVTAMTAMERAVGAWSTYLTHDPVASREALISGDVLRVEPVRIFGAQVLTTLSTPVRLKPGSTVTVFDAGMTALGQADLAEMSVDANDEVSATFTPVGARGMSGAGWTAMARAVTRFGQPETFYVAAAPYGAFGKPKPTTRWTDGVAKDRIVRDVPLDVIAAGA